MRLRRLLGRRARRFLESGRTFSGREARSLGLVDHAFCDRRAKIELRTFLDRLERRGEPGDVSPPEGRGFAAERRHFVRSLDTPTARATIAARRAALRPLVIDPPPVNPVPPFPAVVGLLGDDDTASRIAADAALRGCEVLVSGRADGVRKVSGSSWAEPFSPSVAGAAAMAGLGLSARSWVAAWSGSGGATAG